VQSLFQRKVSSNGLFQPVANIKSQSLVPLGVAERLVPAVMVLA
jgi:hypothetical protein